MKLTVKKETYTKDITLLTYKQMMAELKAKFDRIRKVKGRFWEIEHGTAFGENPLRTGSIASITTKDYLDSISWVSLRTQASFAMPCANCGTTENVQQHHIRHIRKTAYELISKDLPYKQILALRNRKQIPLCFNCHIKVVHAGKYSGTALIKLTPTTLVDNRTIHVESFVKPGIEYHSKSLEERGWTKD